MEQPNSGISFLSLSAELRNHIYELALISLNKHPRTDSPHIYIGEHTGPSLEDESSMPCADDCCDCIEDLGKMSSFSKPPALLRVNRQIREEASRIYYGANTFIMSLGYWSWKSDDAGCFEKVLKDDYMAHIIAWLKGIGKESAAQIRKLQIIRLVEHEVHHNPTCEDVDDEVIMNKLRKAETGLRESKVEIVDITPYVW